MTNLKLMFGAVAGVAHLSGCSPPDTQHGVTQTQNTQPAVETPATPPIDVSELGGKPGCATKYELTGSSDVLQEKAGAIIERGLEVTGALFQQHIAEVGNGAPPAYGGIGFGKYGATQTQLDVLYLAPCSEAGEASARLLAAIHNDSAMSQLLDGARFVFASQVEQPLRISAPTPHTGSPQ